MTSIDVLKTADSARPTTFAQRLGVILLSLCASGTITLPLAQADPPAASNPACTAEQRATAHAASASKIAEYLRSHAEVNTDLTSMREKPRDERRAELKTYLREHPEVAQALKEARTALRDMRTQCKPS
ncbi:MAG: hemophore-related protein [Mycobacteriaceae bacterium]